MAEILTYDTTTDSSILNEEEQDSLQVGEKMAEDQEQLLAGKYKSAQDLEKAYDELQKKLGESNEEPEATAEEEEEAQPEETPVAETLLSEASQQFEETGTLTEEMMSRFTDMSSQELVETYMKMQKNAPQAPEPVELTDKDVLTIKESVGGEAQYDKLMDWANSNIQQHQVDAFDDIISTGNVEAIQLVVEGLKSRYEASNGYEGRMLSGKAARDTSDVFRSQAELVQAMSDPRYERDPAYRNDLLEKLDRSDLNF